MNNKNISLKIKKLMQFEGLNIAKLGRLTDIPRTTLAGQLRLDAPFSLNTIYKVAKFFDVSIDWLVK